MAQCTPTLTVPPTARISEPYWHRDGEAGRYTFDDDAPFGLPYRPTPFYVQVTFGFAGSDDVFGGLAVTQRYEGDIFGGEKRSELLVVPPVSVAVSPEIAIVPSGTLAPPPPPAAARPTGTQGRGARPATPAPTPAPVARGATPAPTPAPAAPPPSASTREIRVTVVNNAKGGSEFSIHLDVPQGWTSTPAQQPVKFDARERSADRPLRREAGGQRRAG